MERGLHAESTYASFLLLGQNLGLTEVSIRTVGPTPLSVNVVSPLANTLARIAPAVMIIALGLICWLFYRRSRKNIMLSPNSHPDTTRVINYSFLVILVFMLTSNIFSPQFLIWLYPVIPLITGRWKNVSWIIFSVVSILTHYLFPMHYNSFMRENPQMIYVLLSRNILLTALAILLVEWKQTATVVENQPIPRFSFKPFALIMALTLAATSILFTQIGSNTNILPSELKSEMPGRNPPDGRTEWPNNGGSFSPWSDPNSRFPFPDGR